MAKIAGGFLRLLRLAVPSFKTLLGMRDNIQTYEMDKGLEPGSIKPVSNFLNAYVVVALVALLGVLVGLGGLTLSRLIRPKMPEGERSLTYESGTEPSEAAWSQSHVRYYLYAILFVVFDIEVAFIVPWAIQVESFGAFGLAEMFIFVAILTLGLAYAWRKGVLKWD